MAGTAVTFEAEADYVNHYMPIDPRLHLVVGDIGQWRCCHHVNDKDFVNHNEFYQDFWLCHR
jgi:hypothetical protein